MATVNSNAFFALLWEGCKSHLEAPSLQWDTHVLVHEPGFEPLMEDGFVHGDVGLQPRMADPIERAPIFLPHSMTHSLLR